jgi:hypothetical protein
MTYIAKVHISRSLGDYYEDGRRLKCCTVLSSRCPTFQRSLLYHKGVPIILVMEVKSSSETEVKI